MLPTINTIRSKHFQLIFRTEESAHNLLQISFGKDGSIYFGSECFKNPLGTIESLVVPPGQQTSNIKLENIDDSLKTIKKTSVHQSGQTHVSVRESEKKILVKKIAPLPGYNGHLFTIQIQGFEFFSDAQPPQFRDFPGQIHTLDAKDHCEAVRAVAWYYDADVLKSRIPNQKAQLGPSLPLMDEITGKRYAGMALSPPLDMANSEKILILQFIPTSKFDTKNRGSLLTLSAFDEDQISRDIDKETSCRLTRQVYP